jgi:hypothetical protein
MLALGVLPGRFAHASWMIPGSPWRPKDSALIKKDGLYHIFFIRNDVSLPYDQTERDLGHAVSKDLWIWTQLPGVVPVRDASWDQSHIWAPSIVEQDGVYYLFYTGVRDVPGNYAMFQQTGLATSTDLMTWNQLEAPIYSCADVPWSWCDSTDANTGFRDPFVMPDPAAPGHWLMYTSTFPESDHGGMVLDVARSSGDLTQWSDVGPLWITHRSYSASPLIESGHLFEHAGLWYVFYTTNASQPISFSTGPDPVGAPETWTYRGRLGTMLGINTASWYASEHLADGLVDYFSFVLGGRIEIYRMVWGVDWRFSFAQPDFMHVHYMGWDRAQAAAGDSVTLKIAATAWSNRTVKLEASRLDSAGAEELVAPSTLGLPDSVLLDADTTRVLWIAQRPDETSPDPISIRVRMTDHTAETGWISVAQAPPPPPPPPPDPSDPQDGGLEDRRGARGIVIRSLVHGPYGDRPAFLIDMPQSGQARLDVYDLQGRHVRCLAQRELPPGATVILWDERDANGAPARPGVYFARMVSGSTLRTARVVVVAH